MERIITFLAFPALLPFVIAYKMGKSHELCRQDLIATLHHRSNPFRKELFQLLYFILWLPEYRSVFYRRNKKFGLIFRILLHPQKCLYIRTSSSRMGGGIVVQHGHSTEINALYIGKNCIFFQNVTIGTNGSAIGPKIGNNCFFGAECTVLGNINIGDNVKIGANAIVTKDIPDNCTVVTKGTSIVKMNGKKVNIIL